MNLTLKVDQAWGLGPFASGFSCEFKQHFETLRAKL